ncbi:MAG: polyprenyl synthetase family protein [candidate division KSB1 bacterium]|nr:polyprenyl synthetase family protein [candidate division KSB1 bacterium]MDZ7334198.1 polyprenyl synthetase family protein [candidate division KSB1 bacterium]MDZ7357473.1 polyprenyl synthetase family protein [candidate division KSB1 bacterium]MDZ7376331.1 polyprenyl synthetase family protein [candidate division KSB1 bacterium]MDZ7400891.1 polyprenyl synthetase family protein [candidate division KSB1 bacterium]
MAAISDFQIRMEYYRALINERLSAVGRKSDPASFYEPVRYVLEAGGKRIRPILVILACQASGGRVESCLDAAVAVEILHNFTLVHDDIMDRDDLRRNRMTVHKRWDEATAILAGDGLVALAYHYLFKTEHGDLKTIADIFTKGLIEVCEGQALDKEFEGRFDIGLDQYLLMIEKKTARLLMIASEIGAIIGGANQRQRAALVEFSRQLGNAFQIQDDLLDMETTSGKTYGSDIKRKKRTLLLVHAFEHAEPSIRKQLWQIMHKPEISDEDVQQVRALLDVSGTLRFASEQVELRIQQARQELAELAPSDSRDDLALLLQWIMERKA